VLEAALMMGTPSNQAIMRTAGCWLMRSPLRATTSSSRSRLRPRKAARAAFAEALEGARQAERRQPSGESAWRPRSLAAAVKSAPGANLALISVPGEFAAAEARKALNRGLMC
jgi:succinyl-CoA synthetase alpha subunit